MSGPSFSFEGSKFAFRYFPRSRLLLLLAFLLVFENGNEVRQQKSILEGRSHYIPKKYRYWYFSFLITTWHKIYEVTMFHITEIGKKPILMRYCWLRVLWPMILGNRVIMVTPPRGHITIELLYNTHIRQRYRVKIGFSLNIHSQFWVIIDLTGSQGGKMHVGDIMLRMAPKETF